jgi:hypothetical protein
MNTYNKLMLYFWLLMTVFVLVVVTYMGISQGFRKWSFYYVFAGIALFMFVVKRWMMKRMEKHVKFLEEQQAQNK